MDKPDEVALGTLSKIYDDIREEESFPTKTPLLAHYTSLFVGESILTKQEIWLSNPLYMNDHQELAYGFDLARRLVFQSKDLRSVFQNDATHNEFLSAYNWYATRFESEEALETFVACFCDHNPNDQDGLLSMWRGYGHDGKGLALIFDTSQISELKRSPIILAPVHYASNEDRELYLKTRVFYFSELLKTVTLNSNNIILAAKTLFERMMIYSIFIKHTGFKEENEWRAVYVPSRDDSDTLTSAIGYRNGARGIEPNMVLNIAKTDGITQGNLEFHKILHTILLGPNGASDLSEASFKRMLKLIGKPHFMNKVRSSRIPYRPTPR